MKNNGFTLLEILMAIVLFTGSVSLIVMLFANALVASTDAENTTIAMNLAQGKMEEVRNLSFASIADEAKAAVTGFTGFQREVAVTTSETDLKQVTVTTYWTYKGGEVEVPLVTYISKN
ncbi:MAG: type II secretion system protein [Candidatus Omnitrophica bacterium]|nr:type II secretion system protein [Candidatus Omnitrophota bacterium]